eukprot:TRINITY_DN67217_c0_g1_i1.p1 TRINITY_DN67217_c0_g1~~TRINITY_DN67217_c0_g1_i1.p1  ORF type:complete len:238 (-),score=36.56 TRINITY_DN67217_c0_g1_i1:134-847(-)
MAAVPACPAPSYSAPEFIPHAPPVPPPAAEPMLPPVSDVSARWGKGVALPALPSSAGAGGVGMTVAVSRSTSPGSSCTPRSLDDMDGRKSMPKTQAIPFVVSNTFINTVPEQDFEDLEGYFEKRKVHSCPASPILSRDLLKTPQAVDEHREMAAATSQDDARRVLRIAEALGEPISSHELPSMGSRGHFDGSCKPCAFFHTKGCGNGKNCTFCHLCDADAKKRRRKERIARWRDVNA